MERLCIKIACTPNDFIDWNPDNEQIIEKNHPLFELKERNDKLFDLNKSLSSLPLKKLKEIEKLINEK